MSLPRAKSADELFKLDDRPAREIDIPEWGVSVLVRELDAKTMALISKSTTSDSGIVDSVEFSARVILEGIVEPKLSPTHLEQLKTRSNAAFLRLYNEIAGKKKESLKN
jgi:hypothetical protein